MFSNELVCDLLSYIHENINDDITMEKITRFFFFDKTYIMKRFKKEIGLSIHTYINHIRIYNSLPLFKQDHSILKIALLNGFQSLEYFSETFKKIMRVSPTTYKKFVCHQMTISLEEYEIICNSLISLQSLKDFSTQYSKNRKPKKAPIKKMYL